MADFDNFLNSLIDDDKEGDSSAAPAAAASPTPSFGGSPSDVENLIRSKARELGVPENIALAVAQKESSLNPNASGPVIQKGMHKGDRAIGLYQLMGATADELGVDRNDPEQNVIGGLSYLKSNYDKFGSWDLAVAAHQAGPGAVKAAGNAIPGGTDGLSTTKQYVSDIMARAEKLKGGLGLPAGKSQASTAPKDQPMTLEDWADQTYLSNKKDGKSSVDYLTDTLKQPIADLAGDKGAYVNMPRQFSAGMADFLGGVAGLANAVFNDGKEGMLKDVQNWGLDKVKEMDTELNKDPDVRAANQAWENADGFWGALGAMKDKPEILADILTRSAAPFVATLPLGAIGGVAGRAALGTKLGTQMAGMAGLGAEKAAQVGAMVGATLSASGGEGLAEAGSAYNEIEQKLIANGLDPAQARSLAVKGAGQVGLMTSALSLVGTGHAAAKLVTGGIEKAGLKSALKSAGMGVASSGVEEGLQEGFGDELKAQRMREGGMSEDQTKTDFGKSFAGGMVAGVAMGGAGEVGPVMRESLHGSQQVEGGPIPTDPATTPPSPDSVAPDANPAQTIRSAKDDLQVALNTFNAAPDVDSTIAALDAMPKTTVQAPAGVPLESMQKVAAIKDVTQTDAFQQHLDSLDPQTRQDTLGHLSNVMSGDQRLPTTARVQSAEALMQQFRDTGTLDAAQNEINSKANAPTLEDHATLQSGEKLVSSPEFSQFAANQSDDIKATLDQQTAQMRDTNQPASVRAEAAQRLVDFASQQGLTTEEAAPAAAPAPKQQSKVEAVNEAPAQLKAAQDTLAQVTATPEWKAHLATMDKAARATVIEQLGVVSNSGISPSYRNGVAQQLIHTAEAAGINVATTEAAPVAPAAGTTNATGPSTAPAAPAVAGRGRITVADAQGMLAKAKFASTDGTITLADPTKFSRSTLQNYNDGGITGARANMLQALGRAFGRNVVFFDQTGHTTARDGFVMKDRPDVIFLNRKTSGAASAEALFGHELLHTMPEDIKGKFIESMSKVLQPDAVETLKSYINQPELDHAGHMEEISADLFGNGFNNPEMIGKALEGMPMTAAQKLIQHIRQFVQKAIRALGGQKDFETQKYVSDLQGYQQAWVQAFRDYLQRENTGQGMIEGRKAGSFSIEELTELAASKDNPHAAEKAEAEIARRSTYPDADVLSRLEQATGVTKPEPKIATPESEAKPLVLPKSDLQKEIARIQAKRTQGELLTDRERGLVNTKEDVPTPKLEIAGQKQEKKATIQQTENTAPDYEGQMSYLEQGAPELPEGYGAPMFSSERKPITIKAEGKAPKNENHLGLVPRIRTIVKNAKVFTNAKGAPVPLITQATTNKNATKQLDGLDTVLKLNPDPVASEESWNKMSAMAFGSTDVPAPPAMFIKRMNEPKPFNDLIGKMSSGQIADADHGFSNARQFRRLYLTGEADVTTTGKLFLWSFLSRGVSPYTQEGLFVDAVKGAEGFIQQAAEGKFDEKAQAAYSAWAESVAPPGTPGRGASHNLNAFGKQFLAKMSVPDETGKSGLQQMHDMMSDPKNTGKDIRRAFQSFGEGVGIDNKVVSFTLLVAGYEDVMVLDRVQIGGLWNDGRFDGYNLYDGATRQKADGTGTEKIPGSGLADLTSGVRGLMYYEAIERALSDKVEQIYSDAGRPRDASIGRFHWDTWVAYSGQEASHGTLDAIRYDAEGVANPYDNVTAKEGEYGGYNYGMRYGKDDNGRYFIYTDSSGTQHELSVAARDALIAAVKDPKTGVVPRNFKVTVNEDGTQRTAPWYEDPRVNREKLDEQIHQHGTEAEGERLVRQDGEGEAASSARFGATATRSQVLRKLRDATLGEPGRDEGSGKSPVPRNYRLGAGRFHDVTLNGTTVQARTWSVEPAARNVFRSLGHSTPAFLELHGPNAAEAFRNAITSAKEANPYGAAVYVYDANDYADMKLFLTKDGNTGFAIKKDGDIVSVFNHGNANPSVVPALMHFAVQQGGFKLDAFDTVLPQLYAAAGFEVKARYKWDDNQAPAGWDKELFERYNNGEPDVVQMAYNRKRETPYDPKEGEYETDWDKGAEKQVPQYSSARGEIGQTWQMDEPTKMDNVIYTMQDKNIDLKRVVDAVKKTGAELADEFNPRLQEELYHGRVAKQTKDFLDHEMKPLLQSMSASKVSIGDLNEYMHMRHAEERNNQIASINEAMPDGGSGVKTADAKAYLDGLDPQKKRTLEALAKRVDAITQQTRDLMVSSGLETKDTIDTWESAYKNYVPLFREDVGEGNLGVGAGFSVKGSASKRAMGSDKNVADILANVAMMREKTITRAEKARVGRALFGLAVTNPNEDFWVPVVPGQDEAKQSEALAAMGIDPGLTTNLLNQPTTRVIDSSGMVRNTVDNSLASQQNVITVRNEGKDMHLVFNPNNERAMRMVRSMKNLDAQQLGIVLGNVAKVTRFFAAVNTQYNPIFGILNVTRDTGGLVLNLSTTDIAGKQADVLANIPKAMKGIFIALRNERAGKQTNSVWAGLFDEFQKEGGQTGYRDLFGSTEERGKALAKEMADIEAGKAKMVGKSIMGLLNDFNDTLENATRLSAYKVAKENGMTNQQAASLAKNLTVNFNRKGEMGTQAGALYAFFNASVQGTARVAETLAGPMGKKIVAGGALLGVMQAFMLAAAGIDDDTPDFVKDRNVVIPIGDKKYIAIPMPQGFNVIPGIMRKATELALRNGKDPMRFVSGTMDLLADNLNPIGNAGLSMQTLTPTALDPVAALMENKDWTGKPIAKQDRSSLNPTPGHTRMYAGASDVGKGISRAINMLTGGNEYSKGMLSPTPDQIDYLIGQVTGGVGREALKANATVQSMVTGEELPSNKMPLLGRFYGNTKEGSTVSAKYFENITKLNQLESEVKARTEAKDDPIGFKQDNPETKLIAFSNQVEREISNLNKMKQKLIKQDADKSRIEAISNRIKTQQQKLNDRLAEMQ